MKPNFAKMKMPTKSKKSADEQDFMMDLDTEGEEPSEAKDGMPEMAEEQAAEAKDSPAADLSDDELMAEFKKRGLKLDDAEGEEGADAPVPVNGGY